MHDLTDMEKAKLPKWARQYIENLHRDMREAQRVADQARRTGPTKVAVGFTYTDGADYWADDQARVRFVTGPDEREEYLEVVRVPGGIQVHGGCQLHVVPAVTNVLEIHTEQRDMDRNLIGVFTSG